ncbi:unnamed protein product [Caenorhabditis auriculariae]|uniref:Reverse transcriptase domain-containing protein n=1 Tax=Caenorhabditis auriculariae TaxID=2777116 RepID=A0A8S1HLP3_9PELO|nr:unnamed protein product [Caenorhabditis auriculariae]
MVGVKMKIRDDIHVVDRATTIRNNVINAVLRDAIGRFPNSQSVCLTEINKCVTTIITDSYAMATERGFESRNKKNPPPGADHDVGFDSEPALSPLGSWKKPHRRKTWSEIDVGCQAFMNEEPYTGLRCRPMVVEGVLGVVKHKATSTSPANFAEADNIKIHFPDCVFECGESFVGEKRSDVQRSNEESLLYKPENMKEKKRRSSSLVKTVKTILIPKKGDLTDLNNFRPISLLSVVYKLFTKVIVNILKKQLDNFQPSSQAGFRRNYSCLDQIHASTQVVERHREHQMLLALAFDSVEINAVLNALVSAGVATKYVELIANSNEGASTTIQLFDKKLSIPIRKDVRGINIDGKVLTNIRFADDIVLFSSSTTELSSMLKGLDKVGKKNGLRNRRIMMIFYYKKSAAKRKEIAEFFLVINSR